MILQANIWLGKGAKKTFNPWACSFLGGGGGCASQCSINYLLGSKMAQNQLCVHS